MISLTTLHRCRQGCMQTWGMPLLPRRFERLKAVLNGRMADLTVLLDHVEI